MKFTDAEAAEIMATAHAHVRRWRDENWQQRDDADRFVCKTIDNARPVPAEPTTVTPVARTDFAASSPWSEWVDGRIAYEIGVLSATIAEALDQLVDKQHASIQAALDKRDHAIQALRDEVEIKIGLGRKLARLKAEVAEARQQAPSFKSELESLRKEVARQEKVISRLRGEQSQLGYAQQQLDAEQQRGRREVTLTAVQLTAFGEQTREVLQRLRESGVDFEDWVPMGRLAS